MKNNFFAGLLIGANLLLAIFLIMGVSSTNSAGLKGERSSSISQMSVEPFIGEISMFAGNFAPRGWAFCEGQLLSISQNQSLFSILGTTYGGDGRTTFGLPDLRGRVPIHTGVGPGLSNYKLGQKGGAETTTLTTDQLPSHNHTIYASNSAANSSEVTGKIMGKAVGIPGLYSSKKPDTNMSPTGNSGGGQALDIRQPYLVVHYIIALQGVYPSRN
jgi:microcystin-dependent protein